MTLLAITTDTWIVTGLGFGIVLGLLFCLVFILQFFGWIMQKATAPKAPKAQPVQPAKQPEPAIAPTQAAAPEDDAVAVAYALFLASRDGKHDNPTSMISLKENQTAWTTKSIGLN